MIYGQDAQKGCPVRCTNLGGDVLRKGLFLVVVFFVFCHGIALAEDFPVTSSFGWRADPFTGRMKFHCGVDLGYGYGAGIPALFDGVAVIAGNLDDGYGNQVLLYHPLIDSYTRYAHCSDLFILAGDEVFAGECIAAVGSTGRSTGAHLHLEYIIRTEDGYQYVNPLILWE